MGKYCAMVVEDEEIIRKGLTYIIDNLIDGWKVSFAVESAAQAMEVLASHSVDLIVTDISMQGMSGLELIQTVQEKYPAILTLIVTGYADFSYARVAIACQSVDYIVKPISPEKLHTALKRAEGILTQRNPVVAEMPDTFRRALSDAEEELYCAMIAHSAEKVEKTLRMMEALICQPGDEEQKRYRLCRQYALSLHRILNNIYADGYGFVQSEGIWSMLRELTFCLSDGEVEKWRDRFARFVCKQVGQSELGVHRTVEAAIAYMNTHFAENISLKTLAKEVGASGNYLSDLFKKETGINYVEYLTNIRIREAKKLLAGKSNPKISDVAQSVGYASDRYMIDVFKKVTGMTPAEYRSHIHFKSSQNG